MEEIVQELKGQNRGERELEENERCPKEEPNWELFNIFRPF